MNQINQLGTLKFLNLSHCSQISDAGLVSLAALTSLISLDLSYGYRITDAGLQALAPLTALEALTLPTGTILRNNEIKEFLNPFPQKRPGSLCLFLPEEDSKRFKSAEKDGPYDLNDDHFEFLMGDSN